MGFGCFCLVWVLLWLILKFDMFILYGGITFVVCWLFCFVALFVIFVVGVCLLVCLGFGWFIF